MRRTGLEILLEELDEPVRFRVGQRAQQDRVHDAEDRRARADAKSPASERPLP